MQHNISSDDARMLYDSVMSTEYRDPDASQQTRRVARLGVEGNGSISTGPYRTATSVFLVLLTAAVSATISVLAMRAEIASARASEADARAKAEEATLRVSAIETVLEDVSTKESQILDSYMEALNNERWFDAHMGLYELSVRMSAYPSRSDELAAQFAQAVNAASDHFSNHGGPDGGRTE